MYFKGDSGKSNKAFAAILLVVIVGAILWGVNGHPQSTSTGSSSTSGTVTTTAAPTTTTTTTGTSATTTAAPTTTTTATGTSATSGAAVDTTAAGAYTITTEVGSGSVDDGTFEQATIVRVVDGDTLIIRTSDGVEQRVRLVGIDAPESVAEDQSRNTEEGREASKYMKSLVWEGQTVYLQKDVSDTDQYDRLLRYVWTEVPTDAWDSDEVATKMLDGKMVHDGYAKAKRYKPDTAYSSMFFDLMDDAIANNRGVSYFFE